MGVLNVNNIRDMKSDAATRVTVALKMGERRARIYQTVLIAAGWVLMTAFALVLRPFSPWHLLYFVSIFRFVQHLKGVWTRRDRELDPMLPMLVQATALLALAGGIGFLF